MRTSSFVIKDTINNFSWLGSRIPWVSGGRYCLPLCEWRKCTHLIYLHPTYLINTVSQQQEGFRLLDSTRSKLMSRDCCKRKEVLFRSHGTWGKGGLPSQSPISLSAQAPPPPFFPPLSIIFLGFDCAECKHPSKSSWPMGETPKHLTDSGNSTTFWKAQ